MGKAARPAPRLRSWIAALWGKDPVIHVLLVAFPVVRFLGVATSGPTLYPDTDSYRVQGGFLDFSLTSLAGRSVRPWGVTAWMALWPSDEAIVLGQTLLSVIAWLVLARTVAAGLQGRALRRLATFVLLVLASTAQVAGWDLAVLGESVSISTGILALAALIRLMRAPSHGRLLGFALLACWFTMTRPNIFPVLLVWAVLFIALTVRRRQLLPWGLAAALLVAFSLYSYVYNVRSDPSWRASWGVTRSTVAYGYPISANDPVAAAVLKDLRRSDAPPCMIPPYPEAVSAHGTTAWVKQTAKTCAGMDAWATAHWSSWWAHWLATHPGQALHIVGTELPNSVSTPVWTDVTAAVPAPVGALFFGSIGLPQAAIVTHSFRTQPLVLWLAGAAAVLWLGRRRPRQGERRGERPGGLRSGDLMLIGSVVGGLASAISSGLLIQTAPFEVGQESAGVTVLLTASCIILVAIGLDRLIAHSGPPALQRSNPDGNPLKAIDPSPGINAE